MNSLFDNKNIFVALSYHCNAFCKKCMTRYHKNRNLEMPVSLIDIIMDKLVSYQYTGTISVGSGEPLLYSNFDYFFKSILSINDSVSLRILSNGMAFNANLPSEYFTSRCKWGITMDGFTQASLTNLQTGIQIDTVKTNITEIVNRYGSDCIYLNYTLHNKNYHEIEKFCTFAAELGISDVYVTELKIYEGFEDRMRLYRLEHSMEVEKKLSNAAEILENHGISSSGIKINTSSHTSGCFLRRAASPIIDVDGSVSFCSGREDILIGNISDANIEKRWQDMACRLTQNPELWCEYCHAKPIKDGCYSLPKNIDRDILLHQLKQERTLHT